MNKIIVSVETSSGTKLENTYVLVTTTAPPEYDGFGAFTFREFDDRRYVLIPINHLNWHEGRYRSGLFTFEVEEFDRSVEAWIANELFAGVSR